MRSLIGNFSFYGEEGTPEDIARLFLSETPDLFGTRADTADLVLEGVVESQAMHHVWLQQDYLGIPIWRGTVVVHITKKDQQVVKVDSAYLPCIALSSLTPALDAGAAAWAARQAVSADAEALTLGPDVAREPQLYVSDLKAKTPRLVWVALVTTPENPSGWRVIVDGATGEALEVYDTRIAYSGTGLVFDPNPVVTYSGNPSPPTDPNAERKSVLMERMDSSKYLRGNWADAYNYSGSRAYDANRQYNYAYTNNWFEEVMAYYHCDTAQSYIQSVWGSGANDGRQTVIVNDTNVGRNAKYCQYETGYPIRIGRDPLYTDIGEDGDIIRHEYSHAVLDDFHQRDYDFFYGYGVHDPRIQSAAVAEGYADYFAENLGLHIEPAFSKGNFGKLADWAFYPGLRNTFQPFLYYTTGGVDPDTITNAYDACGFWSDILLWHISRAIGQRAADALLVEWAATVSGGPTWVEAGNSLLVADDRLNGGINKHIIMTTLKQGQIPDIAYEWTPYASVEVEHGNLPNLSIRLGVRDANGNDLGWVPLQLSQARVSGDKAAWVVDASPLGFFPPTSNHIWYVKVEEQAGDTVIHDQGAIREFYVFKGGESYPDGVEPTAWVPILEDQTVEALIPGPAPSHYAQIELGHSDFSQLEMMLAVKDLTDETDLPGWQLRLTKCGLTGWASPADPVGAWPEQRDRHIRVNLDGLAGRMPPSLARRWYLGFRDNVDDDHVGTLNNFGVQSGGAWYNALSGAVPVAIGETAPQYVNLNTSPPTTASASARLTFAGTATVKAGVGPTGSPYWTSGAWASPYTSLEISNNSTYWPPDLTYRWFLSVANSSGSTGTINRFALYNPEGPLLYRSASPPVTIGAYATVYARVPFKATATFYSDVPTSHWAWMQIEGLYKAGIVSGYGGGWFHPEYVVKRDAMAVFIARGHAGGDANVPPGPSTPTFPDVPTTYWAYKYIEYCASRGIVGGYADGYHPEYDIDRGQLAVFIARAIGGSGILSPPASPTYSDVPPGFWAYKWIEYLSGSMNASGGVIVGGYADGKYHPEYLVDRGQMSVFAARGFVVPQ